MNLIRPFRNADVPQLVDLLHQHHAEQGCAVRVTLAQFEQAILARTFFSPHHLLLAINEHEQPIGWLHYFVDSSPNGASGTGTIAAMCLGPQCTDQASDDLISAAKQQIHHLKAQQICVGVARDSRYGYAGLEPYGYGYGLDDIDQRSAAAFQRNGFVRQNGFVQLVAQTEGYRFPVSREALQFRRSATTQIETRLVSEPRRAAALSHFHVDRHSLVERSGQLLAAIDIWLSDPEAEVMSPSRVIMDLPREGAGLDHEPSLTPAQSYLIASIVVELARRGVSQAETVIRSDDTDTLEKLQKLGFHVAGQGNQWTLSCE